jgi:glutamate racemase
VLVSNGIERSSALDGAGEPPTHTFESTGDDEVAFRQLATRFLGPEVTRVEAFETGAITLPRA